MSLRPFAQFNNYLFLGRRNLAFVKLGSARKVISAMETGTSNPKKTKFPVEEDPVKLLSFCCGTDIYSEKQGDVIKIKDDHEYPEWLWTLDCQGGPSGDELNPDKMDYHLYRKMIAKKQRGLALAGRFPELPKDPIYDQMKPI